MRQLTLILVGAAIGGALAGCGASTPPARSGAVPSPATGPSDPVRPAPVRPAPVRPAPAPPRLVRVSATAYGMALADPRGFALYRFTHDATPASTCYGACASAWPPYLVPRELARRLATGGFVGTTRRTDGRLQVTYAGHPLYYYIDDRRPGQVLCQGVPEFGGTWYVVAPSGHLIR